MGAARSLAKQFDEAMYEQTAADEAAAQTAATAVEDDEAAEAEAAAG